MSAESACYLIFASDTLYLHWSHIPISNALATIKPRALEAKLNISSNDRRSKLMNNCNLQFGMDNHYKGWNLFVMLAVSLKADLILLSSEIGLYLTSSTSLVRVTVGQAVDALRITGVAPFFFFGQFHYFVEELSRKRKRGYFQQDLENTVERRVMAKVE